MKKWIMYFAGIMMALCLAACTPTQVTETIPQAGGGGNPDGITPEMVRESNAAIERLPDQDAPVYEMAFIYYINSSGDGLVREEEDVETLSEKVLVDFLIEKGVLDEGTEAVAFDIEGGEKAGPGAEASGGGERIGTLDLTQFPQTGEAQEQLILKAVANTFIENYELDKMKITINNNTFGDEEYLEFTEDYEK